MDEGGGGQSESAPRGGGPLSAQHQWDTPLGAGGLEVVGKTYEEKRVCAAIRWMKGNNVNIPAVIVWINLGTSNSMNNEK